VNYPSCDVCDLWGYCDLGSPLSDSMRLLWPMSSRCLLGSSWVWPPVSINLGFSVRTRGGVPLRQNSGHTLSHSPGVTPNPQPSCIASVTLVSHLHGPHRTEMWYPISSINLE
jgi:hypothetical protein